MGTRARGDLGNPLDQGHPQGKEVSPPRPCLDRPSNGTRADHVCSRRRVESKNGSYGSWFKNVAEAIQKKDPSHLIVKPEEAAQVIEVIEVCLHRPESSLEMYPG